MTATNIVTFQETCPTNVLTVFSPPSNDVQKARVEFNACKKYKAADLRKKSIITLDWLQLRCSVAGAFPVGLIEEEKIVQAGKFEEWTFDPCGYGNKMYKQVYEVYHYGERFCTLLIGGRMTVHADTAVIDIDNGMFYMQSLTGLKGDIDELLSILGGNVLTVPRLDIAVDGIDLNWLVYGVEQGRTIEKCGQDNFKPLEWNRESQSFEGFKVGSSKSGRLVRYYNKTEEIRESKKKYITEFHKKNGLEGEVYRLEFRLGHRFTGAVDGWTWEKIFSWEALKRLVMTSQKNCFEFVPSQGDKNKSRRKRLAVLFFSRILAPFKRVRKAVKDSSRTEKIVVKRLIRAAAVLDCTNWQTYIEAIRRIIYQSSLKDWIERKWTAIEAELDRLALIKGIKQPNPHISLDRILRGRVIYSMEPAEI